MTTTISIAVDADPEEQQRHTDAIAEELRQVTGESWMTDRSVSPTRLQGEGNRAILLQYSAHNRLIIAGVFPETIHTQSSGPRAWISVAAVRSARSIAQDINRRLLPAYAQELERLHREMAALQNELADRRTLAYDLAGLCGGDVEYVDGVYEVQFVSGAERGRFQIQTSLRASLLIDSGNPEVLCDLAARLGRAR